MMDKYLLFASAVIKTDFAEEHSRTFTWDIARVSSSLWRQDTEPATCVPRSDEVGKAEQKRASTKKKKAKEKKARRRTRPPQRTSPPLRPRGTPKKPVVVKSDLEASLIEFRSAQSCRVTMHISGGAIVFSISAAHCCRPEGEEEAIGRSRPAVPPLFLYGGP